MADQAAAGGGRTPSQGQNEGGLAGAEEAGEQQQAHATSARSKIDDDSKSSRPQERYY